MANKINNQLLQYVEDVGICKTQIIRAIQYFF